MSISLDVRMIDLSHLAERIGQLQDIDQEELLEGIAAEVESQTRRRLSEEKTAPDGQAWPEWSRSYEKTRHSGQSLLESGGDLIDSIQSIASRNSVEVGSNLAYARVHNLGGEIKHKGRKQTVYFKHGRDGSVGNRFVKRRKSNFAQETTVGPHSVQMPQRQYLGFSSENKEDINALVHDFLNEQLRAL